MNKVKWRRLLRALVAIGLIGSTFALVSERAEADVCPCSMFGNGTPSVPDSGPDAAVKLGMKFYLDVNGYATSIRFYKGAGNTGTHVGEIWAIDPYYGTYYRMTGVTFTGETASGWQKATLAAPVFLRANQNYIVSYEAPVGHYAADANYFNSLPSNGAVHAGSPGGMFVYGTGPAAIPGNGSTTNYWVDLEFTPTAPGHSLFNNTTAAPAVPQVANDSNSYELGTRFSSDIPTTVIGIRYWSNRLWGNFSPVHLWRGDGTLLATGEYPDGSDYSGWFEVYFDTPIGIDPSTEYVASYKPIPGHYGYTAGYFSVPYVNGPLHAPTNAGVFKLTATPAFPDSMSNLNYWVEPIFERGATSEVNFSIRVEVEPVLSMTAGGHAGACNGISQSADVSANAAAVNLGHLSSSSFAVAAQDLRVITNAGHGYTLYAQHSGPLNDGKGHTIPDLAGGLSNDNPGSFAAPGTAAFGYTTSDSALSARGLGSNRFTNPSAKWAPMSTSPAEVSHSTTGGVDKTVCIAYGARMAGDTPSGLYATSITYSAVPLF